MSEMSACSAAHARAVELAQASDRADGRELQLVMTRFGKSRTMRRLGIIVAAITVGALLVGGVGPVVTGTGPDVTGSTAPLGAGTPAVATADRCQGGTEVSAFICRNTWMAWTRNAVR